MSEETKYIEMYRILHKKNPKKFRGVSTEKHINEIKDLIKKTKTKTLLDFGCGKGLQYKKNKIHEKWGGIMPTLYDPGWPDHDKKPDGMWDGVICIDVLEHIPENSIENVLTNIIKRATKFVFLNVSTRPAGVILPNGENAHCTIQEHHWWEDKIYKVKKILNSKVFILLESRKYPQDPIKRSQI